MCAIVVDSFFSASGLRVAMRTDDKLAGVAVFVLFASVTFVLVLLLVLVELLELFETVIVCCFGASFSDVVVMSVLSPVDDSACSSDAVFVDAVSLFAFAVLFSDSSISVTTDACSDEVEGAVCCELDPSDVVEEDVEEDVEEELSVVSVEEDASALSELSEEVSDASGALLPSSVLLSSATS